MSGLVDGGVYLLMVDCGDDVSSGGYYYSVTFEILNYDYCINGTYKNFVIFRHNSARASRNYVQVRIKSLNTIPMSYEKDFNARVLALRLL